MTDVDPGTRDGPSFVRASEHGSDTGTDGYVPQPLDKALLGGAPQRIGTFEYRYDTDTWTWSDTVAQMHGYEPGTVQPTTDLVLSHKHPDDVAQVKGLLKQSSAPFSSRHRIITTQGETRKVVVVGDAVFEDDQVVGTRGFYIDITDASNADVQDALGEELEAIIAHREIIDEAKGMLMLLYGLNADSAFAILRWRSQELNIKLHTVAAELVDELPAMMQIAPDNRRVADHYLMTLNAAD
jgi:fructose-specific component phosphotransferase system IIB-like protein